ncbi:MAG: hypothetical protein A3E81_01930 [Gammaproteobacteria bacterium RIFCSPHIGHO2_12_FULL_36_30]|nr:MAG: hypothetical protein A3E81_01930 [Gammaproteobacteria bacterium RIFCSPHIGHO2_12_FULL_36_30]
MRILATRYFSRWAQHDRLSKDKICKAVFELQNGLHDGNLGGSIYKKRIGIGNRGKRDSVRTIIAFQISNNVFCLYGYPKNERDNIDHDELNAFKKAAKYYLNLNNMEIDRLIKMGELIEVKSHE